MGLLQTIYACQHMIIVDTASLIDLTGTWNTAICNADAVWNNLESYQVTSAALTKHSLLLQLRVLRH